MKTNSHGLPILPKLWKPKTDEEAERDRILQDTAATYERIMKAQRETPRIGRLRHPRPLTVVSNHNQLKGDQ